LAFFKVQEFAHGSRK